MAEQVERCLADYERMGEIELGRGDVISNVDLAAHPGDYPVYSSSAIDAGEFGRYGRFMFDEELITWSIDGGGRPFYRPKHRYSVTNVCGYLRIKRPDRWNYRYLHALLERLQSGIQFDYQMKAHPSVIRELYRFTRIPLEEQQTIGAILDTLDTAIHRTEAIIAKLKQVKQGLLHDLLTRGIDANGELRPPQSDAPHLYKPSPLGWIPKEWEASPLSDLAFNLDSQRLPVKEVDRRQGAYPYYGASGIIDWVDSYIFAGDYVLLGEDGENVVSRALPLAFRVTGKVWVNNHAHIYEPKPGVDIRFLLEILEAKDYGRWVSGSAQPKLTQDALARIRFPQPPLREQELIAERLEAIELRIASEHSDRTKLWTLKSGLMDDLLTGRVRVTPLL